MEPTAPLDLPALWADCLRDLAGTTPASRQWLEATAPVGFSDDTIILAAPHSFAREWLDLKMGDTLTAQLSRALNRPIDVMITVAPGAATLSPAEEAAVVSELDAELLEQATQDAPSHDLHDPATHDPRGEPATAPHLDPRDPDPSVLNDLPARREANGHRPASGLDARPAGPTVYVPRNDEVDAQLNPKYEFGHFVIGDSNRFAHAAAVAVAEAPAKSYNPLFIYGPSGLGKTHLLHAIGHYVQRLYPRLRVRYVTTEQFTNEFITSIQNKDSVAFQRRYRDIDVLMIDDIQFLERAERTQEEFFHTFNALHNAEKQIVISSDRSPRAIAKLEDRLRSRFEWGLLVDVQPPELETRIAILRRKAEAEQLDLPNEILELIGARVRSNIRELEGALHRVAAWASLSGSRPDLATAESVLKDVLPDEREREITSDLIMDVVADFFGLTVDDLCSKSRSRQLVNARQIAMYLTRELTEMSFPQIGKAFGGRDHSTVMHAKDKIADLMKERQTTYDHVQELTAQIRSTARGGV
ncbi:chromosomal replication initiator protein DnaA [Salsipaludibacter albus]|uniref:chromosomal replication initiator protein DnaA n=1 Tax=Salsipaludibacter albus TaxID=2849650 RepID=UPI001EE4B96C